MRDFGEALGKANAALDRVQIRQKGDRLYLRATLPPKLGEGDKPKRCELSTGYGAHAEGLRFAKAKSASAILRKLGSEPPSKVLPKKVLHGTVAANLWQ